MSEIQDRDIVPEIGQILADKYDGLTSFICYAVTPTGLHRETTEQQNSLALLRCAIDLLEVAHRQLAERIDKDE